MRGTFLYTLEFIKPYVVVINNFKIIIPENVYRQIYVRYKALIMNLVFILP